MAIKITNINENFNKTCGCNSWLDHWKKHCIWPLGICRIVDCTSTAEFGTCVQKEGDNNWWIIPLCKTHNSTKAPLFVKDGERFVLAEGSVRCGK